MGNSARQSGKPHQDKTTGGSAENKLEIIRNYEDPLESYSTDRKSSPIKRKMTREELLAGYIMPQESTITSKEPKNIQSDPRFKSPDELLIKLAPKPPKEDFMAEPVKKANMAPPPIDIEIKPATEDFQNSFGMPDLDQIRRELEQERIRALENPIAKPISEPMPVPSLEDEPTQIETPIDAQGTAFSNLLAPAQLTERPTPIEQSEPLPTVDSSAAQSDSHQIEIARWKEYAQQVKLWQNQVLNIVNNLKSELNKTKSFDTEIKNLKQQIQAQNEEILKSQKKNKLKIADWMKGFSRTSLPSDKPR